jgi:hypothetical protein
MRSLSGVCVIEVAGLTLAFLGAGCSQQNTYRDDAARQNAVESQQRDQVLAQVVGTYCGKMHLAKSGMDLDVVITLTRTEDNLHSPQSSDPTLNARVPKLAGSMHFPDFDAAGENAIYFSKELYGDLGGTGAVAFDNGDYTLSDHQIYLPYSVPGHTQSQYGELRGLFNSGEFSGNWTSNSFGTAGTFDVTACTTGESSS